ncbi:MAG: PAS domain S-box protein, partial [Candidatus Bathyarchaeia archaeon]
MPETVLESDLTGKITFLSQRAFDITGFSREELEKGLNMLSFVVPEERERAIENIKKSIAGEAHEAKEYTLLRKNGTTFPALVRTNPIISENKVTGLRGLVIDITERKKAEEALIRSMDELVLVNEKLNVVGSLTRHDVRNKLLAVTGNAFLLKKKHPDQPDIIDGLGKIGQACTEIGAILDFAKMYEQLGVEELTYIDVEKTLNEALALFSGSLNVKVINDCRGLTLLADSFLRQLFFNLMDNSVKHGKKVTTIKATYEKVDQDRLNLIYEDDGIGISVQNKPQLFKEGFSTGGSSGYGLYLIRKMMEVYGWAIKENGESDKGAKFV